MRLTETRLRTLIRDVLLEGVREDVEQLKLQLKDDSRSIETLASLPLKWVNWLVDRYLRNKYPSSDSLKDVLPLVKTYSAKDTAVIQKYKDNADFRRDVDRVKRDDTETWKSPTEFETMTSVSMDAILNLLQYHKEGGLVDRRSEAWKSDKIGEYGPWALYFPTNQENSINIAGADPDTLKGYTVWCTARTSGSNLFNNYTVRGIMLFYAVDESKPPADRKSRICLGFNRGAFYAGGEDNYITVDADNKGLKKDDLERIFGDHLGPILTAARDVVQHHSGVHPINKDLKFAAKDPEKFEKMLRGLSDSEAGDLSAYMLDSGANEEVFMAAARHKSSGVREKVAGHENAPHSVLDYLSKDPSFVVQKLVAHNENTHVDTLSRMTADPNLRVEVRLALSCNMIMNPEDLDALARDPTTPPIVRTGVARNLSTPSETLDFLASLEGSQWSDTRKSVARNPNATGPTLAALSTDSFALIRIDVAFNESTPETALSKLADDDVEGVREAVAQNVKTPVEALKKLTHDTDKIIQDLARKTLSELHESRRLARRIVAELRSHSRSGIRSI